MTHAVCIVPVAPIRKFADHASEMTSQLLFGEYCIITETVKEGFAKIIVKHDGYEGWCLLQQLTVITSELFNTTTDILADAWVNKLVCNKTDMYVPFGSSLPGYKDGNIILGNHFFVADSAYNRVAVSNTESSIQNIAFKFLNTPYLWGGRSVFGIDCSGFTQMLYKVLGIALFRDARQQATQGVVVDFLQQAQCGDLAFFDNDTGDIIHAGMLLNDHEIIHASGKVQVDDIDSGGIIDRSTGQRTKKLRIIKRYLPQL